MQLSIEYFDQNETFASQLPRVGSVETTLKFKDSDGPWLLVRLDATVESKGQRYSRLLLMSRWAEYAIGAPEKTSVFILLVPEGATPSPDQSHEQYEHIAWGMVATAVT